VPCSPSSTFGVRMPPSFPSPITTRPSAPTPGNRFRRRPQCTTPSSRSCHSDTHPAYNADGEYTSSVLLSAFLIGITEGLTLGSVIDAGVSTIFVGLAEDPMYVARPNDPFINQAEGQSGTS
jgi:hypothetical protein